MTTDFQCRRSHCLINQSILHCWLRTQTQQVSYLTTSHVSNDISQFNNSHLDLSNRGTANLRSDSESRQVLCSLQIFCPFEMSWLWYSLCVWCYKPFHNITVLNWYHKATDWRDILAKQQEKWKHKRVGKSVKIISLVSYVCVNMKCILWWLFATIFDKN